LEVTVGGGTAGLLPVKAG